MKKSFILILLLSALPLSAANELAISEIDLLVGTPEGVDEPLDSRRNPQKPMPDVDLSELLKVEADFEPELHEINWNEAEEFSDESRQEIQESEEPEIAELIEDLQYLDIFENQESESDQKSKVTDSVETDFKL